MDNINIPWTKIHDFLTYCGNIRIPKQFCIIVVDEINKLIPYDQARIYFLNENGKVYDEYLFGVDKKWTRLYHEYYSHIENGRYSIFANVYKDGRYCIPSVKNCIHNYTVSKDDEFIVDYIRPQGLRYSFGFGLHDIDNNLKCAITLDRTSPVNFNETEVNVMYYIRIHIDNLYRNFFVNTKDYITKNNLETIQKEALLTPREIEITELITNGNSTDDISKKLFISTATVYKHLANIYSKMNVNSRQELLLKLLNN